jgi:hypothetical protein
VKSQLPVVHAVALAPVGLGHALHRAPHEFVLLSSTQTPPQLCVPVGQAPHGAFAAMQAPLQSCWGAAQLPPHFWPSHVAVPPVMLPQAMHEDGPHEPTSASLTHLPPHAW